MITSYFTILFFGISPGELFIILLVVLVLFGPRKIPEIARTLGKGYSELKKAQQELNSEVKSYTDDIEKEADDFQKEVKSVVDGDSQKDTSKQDDEKTDDKNKGEYESHDKQDDHNDADDLPYPYNRNKNLKA